MRKKLDTRFPAGRLQHVENIREIEERRLDLAVLICLKARIKKIMQADEEVGKIAMATPVLISKALELFLQDLCDRTYDITMKRGAKTMNSHHLKECVYSHSVFDFLRETVSRVPDLDAESAGGGENGRRRKAVDGDNEESCEDDTKRTRAEMQGVHGRGRGRGGRNRRKKKNSDKTRIGEPVEKPEDHEEISSPQYSDDYETSPKSGADDTNVYQGQSSGIMKDNQCPKDFDLNMELDENGDVAAKEAEYRSQLIRSGFQLHQDQNIFDPEEDYDCEDED